MQHTPPKFCPEGCGETLHAVEISEKEMEKFNPKSKNFDNHWKWSCMKCGVQGFISEGLKH